MKRLTWRSAALASATAIIFPLIFSGTSVAAQPTPRCGDATATYGTASPESVGLDSAKLQKAIDYWTQHGSDTVKVFRHNCLAGNGALDVASDHVPHVIFSHTKSILSLVVGRAVTQGYLQLDDPVGKYLPTGLGDAAHRALTIRQFLTMTTGLHMNWTREVGGELSAMPDRVREAMSLPIDHKPGTWFEYAQTPLFVLTYVVQRAVGQDFQQYTQEQLLSKIGIPRDHWFWGRDRADHSDGPGWAVFFQPVDFPRFGQLLMNNGTWHGERLIDANYIEHLRKGTAANPGYGYLYWLNSADHFVNASIWGRHEIDGVPIPSAPRDMYFSWGYVGQHVFVIPSLDMIVTRTGNVAPDSLEATDDPGNAVVMGRQKKTYYYFFKYLMESVKDAKLPAPPPYNANQWTTDFDAGAWVNPHDNLAAAELGNGAPQGCTVAGCDGRPAVAGWVKVVQDATNAISASARDVGNTHPPAGR
jgi:CubicO group peptidase (beta-lactamase class C family)